LGVTSLGKALQYALARWEALTRYTNGGWLSADRLSIWPVDRTVNNVRHDVPELLEPHNVPEKPALL